MSLKKVITAFLVSFCTSAAVSLILHAIDRSDREEK